MTTSLYVTVYFATSIAARLRKREDEVMSLSRELRYTADRLQIAYDKLAEIERAKSAYARKVAHELRSPLAAIESLLRVVADGLHGEVPEPVRQTIARARARTYELLAVVRDLLALARAKEAPRSAERVLCDLRSILDGVAGLLAPQAQARGVTISRDVAPDLPCVRGDQVQIEELLTNLIGNAVKYSHDGGVVNVRLSGDEQSIVIEVADSGIGIDEEDQRRIFEDFYRASNARGFTSEGTGLGLSIVKTIVDAHGGTITFESRLGKGTRFTVRLPASGEQKADSG
jgi:signal transduction histidine kinase